MKVTIRTESADLEADAGQHDHQSFYHLREEIKEQGVYQPESGSELTYSLTQFVLSETGFEAQIILADSTDD